MMSKEADKEELPRGFDCPGCGAHVEFPVYVYAHWSDPLTYTCPDCNTATEIRRGRITSTNKPKNLHDKSTA